ncbi:MAG: hypothetical protein R2789_13030 [Microthrixaceae bacterium]
MELIGGDVDALAEEVSRSHVETRRLVGTSSRAHLLNGPARSRIRTRSTS